MATRGRLTAAATALIAACGLAFAGHATTESATAASPASTVAAAADPRPNIVLVVMDDFSMDLLPTMRHALEMRRKGAYYRNSYVVDAQCCPSRASLLTGQYPHQTRVRTNVTYSSPEAEQLGGFAAFEANGNLARSVNVRLQESGYVTGFVGKYLNGYAGRTVPPGWSSWRAILAGGYRGWDFNSTKVVDGASQLVNHPAPPASASKDRKDRAYVGQVAGRMATQFISKQRAGAAPYFLVAAPYGVHSRIGSKAYPRDPLFPPAFRDRRNNCGARDCADLSARDLPGFGDSQADNAPRYPNGDRARQWRPRGEKPSAAALTRDLRNRAKMAQSIDRFLGRILEIVDRNTYVVLTSDNGFHLGQHGLGRGKGAPFTSDVRVPLLVVGPGVKPGSRKEVVSNIDLAPTFEDLAGLPRASYRSGHSIAPTFSRPRLDRHKVAFIEHMNVPPAADNTTDPDTPYDSAKGRIPSYVAVRARGSLLIRFDLDLSADGVDHAWEYYDYSRSLWERTNRYGSAAHEGRVAQLTERLERFEACSEFVRDADVPAECRDITQ
ncbi:MAG TPA: sulfatase-like hydrolase/transferase [Nocardioides sp.]|nr:sulfatase-like hydrolase/transferase [Nocardioides sp.]